MRKTFVMIYAVAWMGFSSANPLNASITVLKMAEIPTLVPMNTYQRKSNEPINANFLRFNFSARLNPGYAYGPGDNPNTPYQATHPYPEIEVIPQIPYKPLETEASGLKAITGFVMQWSPGAPGSMWPEKKVAKWKWEPPMEYRTGWSVYSHPRWKDRYGALLAYPFDPTERDPMLAVFDATSGLKWKTVLPLRDAVKELAGILPPATVKSLYRPQAHELFVALTADGSHTLAIIPRPDLNATLMFIYNSRGNLENSIAVPDRLIRASATNEAINRSRSGNSFQLEFDYQVMVGRSTRECYLADGSGRLVGMFADSKRQPVPWVGEWSIDDRYMHGMTFLKGTILDYLFFLPN